MALRDATITATIGVTDQEAAKTFYTDVLGLDVIEDTPAGVTLGAATGTQLFVYHRPGHRPPENTVAAFAVPDFDAAVRALRDRGVTFEAYDMPGLKTVDGVMTDPIMGRAAWFKDPDGNILNIGAPPRS